MYGRPGPIRAVAEIGQKVLLIDRTSYKLYWVAYREGISPSHPFVANVGVIAAGARVPVFNTTAILDLNDGQLGQFRAHVLDDIHVVINQPGGLARYGLMNVFARLNAFGRLEDRCDHLTEFFILEDDRIFLDVTNPTGYALAQARVAFYGFKYVLAGAGGATTMSGGQLPPLAQFDTIEQAMNSAYKPFAIVPVGGWMR